MVKEEGRVGFEERKTVDMKIYQVPGDTARWFKIWCDRQGLRFNQGIVLLRQIISDYERFLKLEVVIEENRTLISELYEKVVGSTSKQESKPEEEERTVKRPVTYGRKKR